jgi:hypothetical protein
MRAPLLTVARCEARTLRRVGGGAIAAAIAGILLLVAAQMPAFGAELQRRVLWGVTQAALLVICSILPIAGNAPTRAARSAPVRWAMGAWLGSVAYTGSVVLASAAAGLAVEAMLIGGVSWAGAGWTFLRVLLVFVPFAAYGCALAALRFPWAAGAWVWFLVIVSSGLLGWPIPIDRFLEVDSWADAAFSTLAAIVSAAAGLTLAAGLAGSPRIR